MVRTRLLGGLFVLLATALQASSQAAPGGPPTDHVIVNKTGKPGNRSNSRPSNSISGASPGLCFLPGVGWQSNFTGHPSESAVRGTHTSMGLEIGGSSATANPRSVYTRIPSAKHTAGCPEILTDKRVPESEAEKFTILDHPSTIRSAGSTRPGSATSRQATSPLHPSGSAGQKPVWMTRSATPTAAKHVGSEAGPVETSDQVSDGTFHAYISSAKLRRAIRNASDFRTRIKLQQLQKNSATEVAIAGRNTKTGQVAKRSLKGGRIHPSSSSKSDAHDRSLDNPRMLLSGSQ